MAKSKAAIRFIGEQCLKASMDHLACHHERHPITAHHRFSFVDAEGARCEGDFYPDIQDALESCCVKYASIDPSTDSEVRNGQ